MKDSISKERQLVQAFSSITVPAELIKASNIGKLVEGISSDLKSTRGSASHIANLRSQKETSNFISNWWNDVGEKVGEAQLDLSVGMSHLSEKTAQLLIVNTAISKVLGEQQDTLLSQQELLGSQAAQLESQNAEIMAQQRVIEQQQVGINAANRGLMEAKGVTQEQAAKLVGCVTRVETAEQLLTSITHDLRRDVERQVEHAITKAVEAVQGVSAIESAMAASESRMVALVSKLQTFSTIENEALQARLIDLANELATDRAEMASAWVERGIQFRRGRAVIILVACAALTSLGWLIALNI